MERAADKQPHQGGRRSEGDGSPPLPEPIWMAEAVVRAIHTRQLAEHGGLPGVRDEDALASALMRPQNRFAYGDPPPDLASLAASYAYGIARNHPFSDGNKRVALVVCRTFLLLNGVDLAASQHDKYEMFLRLAAGEADEEALASWIRARLQPPGAPGLARASE